MTTFPSGKRLVVFQLFVCVAQFLLEEFATAVENKSDKPQPESLLPLSHSSGVFDETSFFAGAKPLYKPSVRKEPIINRADVSVGTTDIGDLECSQYHRYCSLENIQRNMKRLKETALLEDLKQHSPYYCSCAKDCVYYGDCCWNALNLPNITLNTEEDDADVQDEEKIQVNYKCINMKENTFYYMWSKCPKQWVIEDIKAQCEDDHEMNHGGAVPDGLLLMPVTSLSSNITYKNIFCAVCNNEKRLLPWKLNLLCDPKTSQIETDPQITKLCPFRFSFPDTMETMLADDVQMIFKCENNIIGSLCERTNDTEIAEVDHLNVIKCERYFAPVIGNSTGYARSYKNKFCAFCNGESPENLRCQTGSHRNTPLHAMYGLFNPHLKSPSLPSFSMLLDIDFSAGGSVVGSTTRCSPGSVYDPWTEDCRSVVCGQSYTYSDGICIAKPKIKDPMDDAKSKPISTSEPSLMDVCPKLPVSDGFDITENETLVFHRTKMVFKKGEYRIEDNGTVMICVNASTKYVEKFSEVQSILTIVCISISLICLFLKMLLHFMVPERKNIAPKVIFNLSLSLFIGQLLFVAGAGRPDWGIACTAIAIVTQYAFLSSFFWSNILAYDIWNTFNTSGHPKSQSNAGHCAKLTKYSIYAWTAPLIIVLLSALINWLPYDFDEWRPRYGEMVCWISNRTALLLFFATPLAVLLVVNVVFFASTAYIIAKASKATKMAHENTGKNDQIKLILYVKLAAIMGLTWLFGFVAPFSRNNVVWCFFIVLNGLQGAFLFFAFTKFERVKRKILNWSQTDTETSSSSAKQSNVKKLQFQLSRSSLAASNTNITNV